MDASPYPPRVQDMIVAQHYAGAPMIVWPDDPPTDPVTVGIAMALVRGLGSKLLVIYDAQ
jgi:hypothetical protein